MVVRWHYFSNLDGDGRFGSMEAAGQNVCLLSNVCVNVTLWS